MAEGNFRFTYVDSVCRIRVESDSMTLMNNLLDVYTVENPQYFYLTHRGIPNVDETMSVISPTGTFKCGLFLMVYKTALTLVKNDSSRILIDEYTKNAVIRECKPLNGVFNPDYEIVSIDASKPIRNYQKDAVKRLLKFGRGICISPTGSGKSLVIGTLISELHKKSCEISIINGKSRFLIIVPTRQLVDQMYNDLIEYGITDICMWTSDSGKKKDGTFKDNSCSSGFSNIIITNHDWITKELDRRNKNRNKYFPIEEIGCLIADEVHTVSYGSQISKVIERINAPICFGFTGTLPSDKFKQWSIIGIFGSVVYKNEIVAFQNDGYLAKIEIIPIRGIVKELEKRGSSKYLYSMRHRNKLGDVLEDGTIVETDTALKLENQFFEQNCEELYSPLFDKIISMFDFSKRNMIVLFDRLTIGKTIYSMLCRKLQDISSVYYMDGTIDVSDREQIRYSLENTNGNVLVAQSVTASVGLNIKNLNGIAFCFSGKSFVKVIQSIGRVIRLKKDGSDSKLFELYFNTRYSNSHHLEKMKIFKDNYGESVIHEPLEISI